MATSARLGETERARWEDIREDRTFVRLRGTKTELSDRFVPIAGQAAMTLLSHAVTNAQGEGGMLFQPWTNHRRDIADACKRASIERCSPNDLRRTFATWLRRAGISPDLIAPAMGHVDSRMVERVYGRLTPEQLRENLIAKMLPACSAGSTDSTKLGGFGGQLPHSADSQAAYFTGSEVPRAGIEPATRGFSVPCSTD